MAQKKLVKVGNSLGVVIPSSVLNELGLQAGDTLDIEVSKHTNEIILRNTKTAPLSDDDRFERLVKDAVDKYLVERGLV